jgi:hypothetical protein
MSRVSDPNTTTYEQAVAGFKVMQEAGVYLVRIVYTSQCRLPDNTCVGTYNCV